MYARENLKQRLKDSYIKVNDLFEIMELKFSDNKIEFEKELNNLDKFVIDFCSVLNKTGIKYAVVSGYVAILFGRNRTSEDIDIIIENIDFKAFSMLWKGLINSFECINTSDMNEAYREYLIRKEIIRFSRKNDFIPNVEIKLPKTETDSYTINNRKEIILNKNKFYISPFEMQIAYKLFLGSEKDIEDAKFLYKLFKEKIDMKILDSFNRKFKIQELFNKYLK